MAQGYDAGMPRTTYTDTNLAKRVISDAISMIRPTDTPFLSHFTPGSAESKFNLRLNGTKIEIIEDDLKSETDGLAASAASNATSLTVTNGERFRVGDVIKIDSQYLWVSAISSDTLTVTSVGGTVATHASNATITIVTNARVEGAETTYGPSTTVNQPYNYAQILQDAVKVTRTQQKLAQYGVTNELDRQRDKKLLELWIEFEKACLIEGVDLRSAGSSTTPRIMGSLSAFITTAGNYVTTSTTITKADIDAASLACYEDGGNPRLLMAHPQVIARLRDLLDNSSFVRVDQSETSMGMRLGSVVAQYHDLELVPNRRMNKQYAWLLDPDYIGVYEYDAFQEADVPRGGDYVAREIIGEYSLMVAHGDKAHGLIYTTLSTGL